MLTLGSRLPRARGMLPLLLVPAALALTPAATASAATGPGLSRFVDHDYPTVSFRCGTSSTGRLALRPGARRIKVLVLPRIGAPVTDENLKVVGRVTRRRVALRSRYPAIFVTARGSGLACRGNRHRLLTDDLPEIRVSYLAPRQLITPTGQVGPFQIGRTSERQIRRTLGRPDTTEHGVEPGGRTTALEYRWGVDDETDFFIRASDGRLTDVDSFSHEYVTPHGTTILNPERQASQREGQPIVPISTGSEDCSNRALMLPGDGSLDDAQDYTTTFIAFLYSKIPIYGVPGARDVFITGPGSVFLPAVSQTSVKPVCYIVRRRRARR